MEKDSNLPKGPTSVSTTSVTTLLQQQQNVQIHFHVPGDAVAINIHEAENLMVNTGNGHGVMNVTSLLANEGTDLQLSNSEESMIYEREQNAPEKETSYLHEEDEAFLIERFKEMQYVFVETERYKKALQILLENNFEVITGLSGEGKTFLAMKLIYDLTQKGLMFKEITASTAFHDFESCEKTVFLMDDAFQIDSLDPQWRIVEIQNFIESNIHSEKNNFLIMTSRKGPLVSVKDRMKQSWLLNGDYTIDFTEVGLSMGEKHDIILKHIDRFQPKENIDGIDKMKIAKEVAEVTCQGFANCAYFFVRNKKWFNKGVDFFKNPIKTIRDDVDSLRESDPKIYVFLLYLLLKGGRMRGTTLDTCESDDGVINLLQKIRYFPKEEYCAILNDALHQVEYVYVSRVDSIGTYTFRHDYIVEAVCISFSKILPREAIMNVPFDFISTRIRTDDYNAYITDMIILKPDRYDDLATRFIRELTIGNIRSICEHPASNDAKFSKIFISKLHADTKKQFFIQITERAYRSTLNGSLLYWSASCGAQHLCLRILKSEMYSNIKDKFWLRTQASAALVPSCWFGFNINIIDGLLKLGADINSSIHSERRFQTYTSDCLAVHDQKGWTPVQSAVCGTNSNKIVYIEELIKRGCHFQEKEKMQRPLIHAVQQENLKLVETLVQNGVNIHAVDIRQLPAVYYAIETNQIEVTRLLLSIMNEDEQLTVFVRPKTLKMMRLIETHVDFNIKDANEKGLLHHAEDPDIVDFLVKDKGLSTEILDKEKRTPLYYASNVDVVTKLLELGASYVVDKSNGDTLLHVQKDSTIIEHILQICPDIRKSINETNLLGLHAVFAATSDVLKILIKYNANLNVQCPFKAQRQISGELLLDLPKRKGTSEKSVERNTNMGSVEDSKVEVARHDYVRDFVKQGKGISEASFDKLTDVSSTEGFTEDTSLSQTEIEGCSYDEFLPTKDFTVLMKRASEGRLSPDLLQLCLASGYNISIQDGEQRTIMHYIILPQRRLKEVSNLLQIIINHAKKLSTENKNVLMELLNIQDLNGDTALHLACLCSTKTKLKKQHENIVKTLLDSGSDPNILNNTGEMPQHMLMRCRCCLKTNIFKLLFSRTSDPMNTSKADRLMHYICKTFTYFKDIDTDVLADIKKTLLLLLTDTQTISCFLQYCIDMKTDPNLIVFVIVKVINALEDIKKSIVEIGLKKKSLNSGIILTFMHSQMEPHERDALFTNNNLHLLFGFGVKKLLEKDTIIEYIENLFQQNINVNLKSKTGETFLSWTLKHSPSRNRAHVIEILLAKGAKVVKKESIFDCLQADGDDDVILKCLKLLLQYGSSLSDGCPLIWSVTASPTKYKTLEFIMGHVDTDFSQCDGNGYTVFQIFIEQLRSPEQIKNSVHLFRKLFENMDNNDAFILTLKARLSDSLVLETLHYTNINGTDSIGRTPLQNVIYYYEHNEGIGELEIIKQILKLVGKISNRDHLRRSFLRTLVSRMKSETVKVLLYYLSSDLSYPEQIQTDINSQDDNMNSVLHHVCFINTGDHQSDLLNCSSLRVSIMRILLANGANINIVNAKHQSVLHVLVQACIAAQFEHIIHPVVELINLVISHGINKDKKDSNNQTALDYIPKDNDAMDSLARMIRKEIKPENIILKESLPLLKD
ncbi:uncharacterized protein LOC127737319 isoform X2 [Mytilus californianus]|uniref:uncharacterized protein LOC127737319 isoform X2 n=1 Tax=Mytilus californianus TaxID=6549 RepID=UPI0022468AAD|nr:uncharacterized protein LOC127737319 isoform X2 [Mytilus californianus]